MSLVLIQELPAGRSPVQTRALRDDRPEEREQVLGGEGRCIKDRGWGRGTVSTVQSEDAAAGPRNGSSGWVEGAVQGGQAGV